MLGSLGIKSHVVARHCYSHMCNFINHRLHKARNQALERRKKPPSHNFSLVSLKSVFFFFPTLWGGGAVLCSNLDKYLSSATVSKCIEISPNYNYFFHPVFPGTIIQLCICVFEIKKNIDKNLTFFGFTSSNKYSFQKLFVDLTAY